MTVILRRTGLIALIALAAATSGCTRVRLHQGYIIDQSLLSTVQPGIDNRDSVTRTLGRPTFVSEFDDKEWYYVSRDTAQLAFSNPSPTKQTVFRVTFDKAGNVANIRSTGVEQVASINPSKAETPTLGRNRGFLQDLFGNIGQVGAAGLGGTTPNGGGTQP